MSHILHELRDMLMHELRATTEYGNLTVEKLDIIDKLTHSIKSIDTICAMEESGYSQKNGNSYGMNSYGNTYANRSYGMNSFGNNGSSNNSYNSYASNGNGSSGGSYRYEPNIYYSHDDGRESMLRRLDEMMREAKTDKEREAIKMCMDKLGS